MASKTEATIRGYLASDPRLNETQTGRRVANVSVGYTPQKKTQQGYEDLAPTTWFEAALWDDAAGAAAELRKGDEVVLTGSPHVEVYDRKDGGSGVKVVLRFASCALLETAESRDARKSGRGAPNGAGADQWAQPAGFEPQAQREHVERGGFGDEPPF